MFEKRWNGLVKVEVLASGRANIYYYDTQWALWVKSPKIYYSEQDAISRADELYREHKANSVVKVIE